MGDSAENADVGPHTVKSVWPLEETRMRLRRKKFMRPRNRSGSRGHAMTGRAPGDAPGFGEVTDDAGEETL